MKQQRSGFTLIELVVVILILGILAAVGAPKLFSTSGLATENGVKQTLSIIRDGIELYSAKHTGTYPTCTGTGSDFHLLMKEFVRGNKFPSSPVGTKDNTVKAATGAPLAPEATPTSAWLYNVSTGEFICNCQDVVPSGNSVKYSDL